MLEAQVRWMFAAAVYKRRNHQRGLPLTAAAVGTIVGTYLSSSSTHTWKLLAGSHPFETSLRRLRKRLKRPDKSLTGLHAMTRACINSGWSGQQTPSLRFGWAASFRSEQWMRPLISATHDMEIGLQGIQPNPNRHGLKIAANESLDRSCISSRPVHGCPPSRQC